MQCPSILLFYILNLSQMTNTIQKKFKVSSTQLLYQSSPYQAGTLFISGPFLDGLLTNQNVFAFKYTPQVLVRNKNLCNFTLFLKRQETPSWVKSLGNILGSI